MNNQVPTIKYRCWAGLFKASCLLLCVSLMFTACEDEANNTESVRLATNIVVEDVGNAGNAADLLVSFTPADIETAIATYRIILSPVENDLFFNVSVANGLDANRYQVVTLQEAQAPVALSAGLSDASGVPVRAGVAYRVYVLSVATAG